MRCLYPNYNAILRAGNVSNKYIVYSLVPINIISGSISVASKVDQAVCAAAARRTSRSPRSVAAPGNLVVVLAIGESSRRKNFSLYGYHRRNTNPVLQQIGGLHLLERDRDARVDSIRAAGDPREGRHQAADDRVRGWEFRPSCYVNYTLYDNCAAVGETKVSNCGHGGKCYDEDVIPLLKENLRTYVSGYRFVVLHLGGGSHGPAYGDRHPPEFQQFKPMCKDADVANQCTLEELYNSYDNTILYVDYVLGEAIAGARKLRRSVRVHLSVRSWRIVDGRGRMFHGMPPGIALPAEQAEIPLIVKSSVPISIVERAEYQQPDVFDTVLDLFSIQATPFDRAGSFIDKGMIPARERSGG